MLLGFKLLVALVFCNVIFNQVKAEAEWMGCKYFPYGETAVETAATIKDNLVNVVGFLERQVSSEIPNEVSSYLTTVKRKLVDNSFDIFRLIPYMNQVRSFPTSRERVFFLLSQLESVNFKTTCALECSITRWEVIPNFRNLLDSVPFNSTVHGLPDAGSADTLLINNIGLKFSVLSPPTNDIERDINLAFGPSIMQITQQMQNRKHCFNEKFFGNLLAFYPWPSTDVLGTMALDKLRYYFSSGKISFLPCGIYISDLDTITEQPWAVLDYVLNQMDSSGCERTLEWEIKLLLASRQLKRPRETPDFEVQSLLDLLNIINPQGYPLHIVIAADRVRRFLKKLLPYADIESFVRYRYETPEERLLALLDYVNSIDSYPVIDVSNSLNALKSTLLFQLSSQTVSTKLLNLILDSWWTTDLLDFVREDVVRLKVFVRSHFAMIDEILTLHNTVKCIGIVPCYVKILSILESDGSPSLVAGLNPLPQLLIDYGLECGNTSTVIYYKISDIVTLLQFITCHNYPLNAVMAANNLIVYISQTGNAVAIPNNPHIYTKEELLVIILKTLSSNEQLTQIQHDVNVLLNEIQSKIKGQITNVDYPQSSPDLSLPVVTIANIVSIVNQIRDKKHPFPELDAALIYIEQYANVLDNLLKEVTCQNTDSLTCFNSILQIIKLKSPPGECSLYPLQYVLSPAVCTKTFCRWIPHEELESGPLNPVLDDIKYLLTNLKTSVKHFQLALDVDVITTAINTEDLRPMLSRYTFDTLLESKDILLNFLKLLRDHLQLHEDIRMGTDHIIEYLSVSNRIETLSPQNLLTLIEMLMNMTTSEAVASQMRETLQLLYKNKDKLSTDLMNLKVDCVTLETCVSTLILETNYTTDNSIINLISNAVAPKICTPIVCPWYNKIAVPNQILSWVMSDLVQLSNDRNLPLAIIFSIERMKTYLLSSEFLPVWKEVSTLEMNANNAVTTVLKFIAQDISINSIIRHDSQNILNYIADKIPPHNINSDDLTKLLIIYGDHLNNKTTIETVNNILGQIQTHPARWENLLTQFDIECTTLQYCLNNLVTALKNYDQHDEIVILLLSALHDFSTHPTESEGPNLTVQLLQQIDNLLSDRNVPTIIKIELRVLKHIVDDHNLFQLFNNLIGVSPDHILFEVLRSLPIAFKLEYKILEIVSDLIRYLMENALPTRLSLLSIKELAYILVDMTNSDDVKMEIQRAISTLEQLPDTSEVLLHLPVKGDTLQSCVDSIIRNIQQTSSNNMVMQNIYGIVRPPTCNMEVCPWIGESGTNDNQVLVDEIKRQLTEAIHRPDAVLLVKIYADRIMQYIVPAIVSQSGANNLLEFLDALVRDTFPIEVKNAALALLKYIDRNIVPTIWNNIDFLGLAQIMTSMTDSPLVIKNLQVATNRILFHGPLVNMLLRMCHIDGMTVKIVTMKIYECARRNPFLPSSPSLIEFVFLPSCNSHSCPWLTDHISHTEENETTVVVHEINVLLNSNTIPFHIKLDLTQIRDVIFSKLFKDMMNELLEHHQIRESEFATLIKEGKNKIIKILGTENSAFLTLLEKIPGNVFASFNVYRSLFNIVYYISKGIIPQSLEFNTLRQLFQIIANSVKNTTIFYDINASMKNISYIPNVGSWIPSLTVNCKTYQICIKTLTHSIEQQTIPLELRDTLLTILKHPNCNNVICPWIVKNETDNGLQQIERQLTQILSNTDVPINVQIAIAELLQELQKEQYKPGEMQPAVDLQEFLTQIIHNKRWNEYVRYLSTIILSHVTSHVVTEVMNNCRDIHQLVQYLLKHTNDMMVQYQLQAYDNRLSYLENDCSAFLKQCHVVCTNLNPCVAQLYDCAQRNTSNVANTIKLLLYPPICTPLICSWLPTGIQVIPTAKNPRNVIIVFEVADNDWKSVMLDLNNPGVVDQLRLLSPLGSVVPNGVAVLPIEVSPGQFLNLPIDLSNKYIQSSLLSSKYATNSFVDVNTMKDVAILWPFKGGRTQWVSFDLTNEVTRKELKRLSERQCPIGKPTITIRDENDLQYVLCIDYNDMLLLTDLIRISVDGKRIVTSPLLFWPRYHSVCWGALEISKLSEAELGLIQSFPSMNMVGLPVDTLVTALTTISFTFDVFDSYVRQMLATISRGKVPGIDLNMNKTVAILVPNDFGMLTNVYVKFDNSNMRQLLKLTKINTPVVEPTFYLQNGNQKIPVCINLNIPAVRDWLLGWNLPGTGSDFIMPSRSTVQQIVTTLMKQIHRLISKPDMPYIIKLQLEHIVNTMEKAGSTLVDTFMDLSSNVLTTLEHNIRRLINSAGDDLLFGQGPLVQILYQLRNDVLNILGIARNVDTLISYFENGVVTNTMDVSTVQTFIHIIAKNTTKPGVAQQIDQILNQIVEYPVFPGWLDQITLTCDTYQNCVQSLVTAVNTMDDGQLKTMLTKILNIVNVSGPGSSTDVFAEAVKKLNRAITILLKNNTIPFVVKLELQGILFLVDNQNVLTNLRQILNTLPENTVTNLVTKLSKLVKDITSNKVKNPVNIVTQLLQYLPQAILIKYNLKTTIDNINTYFTSATRPNTFSMYAISGLTKLLSEMTNDSAVSINLKDVGNKIFTLGPDASVNIYIANCMDLQSCVNSLWTQLSQVHTENEVSRILSEILKPQNCEIEHCPWIPEDQTQSRIIHYLFASLNKVINSSHKDVPLHIILELQHMLSVLNNKDAQKQLQIILKQLPESELNEMIHKADYMIKQLNSTQDLSAKDIILSAIENLPSTFLKLFSMDDTVTSVKNYFENGVLPETLNWNTFHNMITMVVQNTNDTKIVKHITQALVDLEKNPNKIKDVLGEAPVKCLTIDFCLQSLLEFLQTYPTQSDITSIIIDMVKDSVKLISKPGQSQITPDNSKMPFALLPISDCLEYIILNLKSKYVLDKLEYLTYIINPQYPTMVFEVPFYDGIQWKRYKIKLDTNDWSTIQTLRKLMPRDLKRMRPRRLENQFGQFIVGVVEDKDNRLYPFVLPDTEQAHQYFLQFNVNGNTGITLPFTSGRILVRDHPRHHTAALGPLCVPYISDNINVQPQYIPLPGDVYVKPNWPIISQFNSSNVGPGTQIPITNPDGTTGFITLDFYNQSVIDTILTSSQNNQVRPKPGSILAITDIVSAFTYVIDLNSKDVVNALKEISAQQSNSGDLITINIPDSEGHTWPIIIDLVQGRPVLQNISQFISPHLEPTYIYCEDSMGVVLTAEDAVLGGSIPVVLNLSDSHVTQVLNELNQPTNPGAVSVLIPSKTGASYQVFLDMNNMEVVRVLMELSRNATNFIKPGINISPTEPFTTITIPSNGTGATTYKIQHMTETTLKKLEELSVHANPNTPFVCLVLSDGVVKWVKLDMSNPAVTKILKNIATKIETEGQSSKWIVINNESGNPIILNTGNPSVINQLVNMSLPYGSDAHGLFVVIVEDQFGNPHTIVLNTTDASTKQKLQHIQETTTPGSIRPIEIITSDGNMATLVTFTDNKGKVHSIIVRGSNSTAVTELKNESDIMNPNATKLIIYVDNKAIPVYLDLSKPKVRAILSSLAVNTATLVITTPNSQTSPGIGTESGGSESKIVILPVNENGYNNYIKCDVNNKDVSDRLEMLSKLVGPRPVFVTVVLKDKQVVLIDTTQPDVIAELRTICSESPGAEHVLLVTVTSEDNKTVSYVLNTLDSTVVQTLKNISQETSEPGLTSIQLKDTDGSIIHRFINLTDSNVLKILHQLHDASMDQIPAVMVLKNEKGEDDLLLIKAFVQGSAVEIVLDVNDKNVINTLLNSTDVNNANAIPIQVNTTGGILTFYIDRLNPYIAQSLINLASERPIQTTIVNPKIIKTKFATLSFSTGVHTTTVSLNLDNEDTKAILLQSSVPKSETTIAVFITLGNGTIIPCYIDVTDDNVAQKLVSVATKVEYKVDYGSLLIIPVVDRENGTGQYIIVDVFSPAVVKKLQDLTEQSGDKYENSVFFFTDKNRQVHLCKLNLQDNKIVKQLHELVKHTPPWIVPTTIINPYGPAPYFVTTILAENEVKPIVLDLNSVTERIERLRVPPNTYPTRPLDIICLNSEGLYENIKVDVGNPETVNELLALSIPPPSVTPEILTNRPVLESVDATLCIPIQKDKDHIIILTFDTSNLNVFNEILSLAASPQEPSTIIYMQSPTGETVAIRINTKDEDVITKLKYNSKGQTVQIRPTAVCVFVVEDTNNVKHIILLDLANPEVVDELKNLTRPRTDDTVTIININDQDGNPVVVALDLLNPNILKRLEKLQLKTPQNIVPVYLPSPLGPKPIIVSTIEGDWHNSLPIVIDTNNPEVIPILSSMSNPNDSDAYVIYIPVDNKLVPFYLNPSNSVVKQMLMYVSSLTKPAPFPIMLYTRGQLVTIPIETQEGTPLRIVLDSSDSYAMGMIRNLAPSNQVGVVVVLPSEQESGQPDVVKINKRDVRIIGILKKLGQRLFDVVRPRVIPSTGPLPLISFYIQVNGTVQVITLDINLPEVMQTLLSLNVTNDGYSNIKRLRLPKENGDVCTLSFFETPELYNTLQKLAKLTLAAIVEPIRQLLPNEQKPLVTITLKDHGGSSPVTIDTEDDNTLEELRNYNVDNGPDLITIVFNTPKSGVVPIKLSYADDMVIDALKKISKKTPSCIIPVPGSYPVISIVAEHNERIRLDTNNNQVVVELLKLSKLPDNDLYPQSEVIVKNENGLAIPIKIAFNNPLIHDTLIELSKKTPIPPVIIIPNIVVHKIPNLPVRILPPGKPIWPLILHTSNLGQIVLDPNNYRVMNTLIQLSKQTQNGPKAQNAQTMFLTDIDGNVVTFTIDFNDNATVNELKKVENLCPIQFEPKPLPYLPTLIVKIPDRFGSHKPPLQVDLQNVDVLNTVVELSRKNVFKNPYRLQIMTNVGPLFCLIDFADPRVYRVLERFKPGSNVEPYFVTFDVPDTFGNTWRIIIDMENGEVTNQLYERSNATSGKPSVAIELKDKAGVTHTVDLNLYDVSTINLLKQLTLQSTGREAQLVKKKEQYIVEFTALLPGGNELHFSVDTANENVLKKLKQLSSMFNGKTESTINLPLPDGSAINLKFDFTDPVTLQNLHNIEEESHDGRPRPLIPLQENHQSNAQQLLITFTLNSPHYGPVPCTIDLNMPHMIDKLKDLSASFQSGRPMTQVPIDNQQGISFVLQLDLTDPRTIEYLAKLTEESTGTNPLEGKPPGSVQSSPYDIVTLELPSGVEVLPITLNTQDRATLDLLNRLDRRQPFNRSLTTVAVGNSTQVNLDTTNLQTVEDLMAEGIPTVFPVLGPAVSLLTYFFLLGDNGIVILEIDLALKPNVLNLMKLSQYVPLQVTMPNPVTVIEIRDDTGQYLRIPIFLRHPEVVSMLLKLYPPIHEISVNAERMPSIVLVVPQSNDLPHMAFKFQTKPKVLRALVKLLAPYQAGVPIRVLDILNGQHQCILPISDPALPSMLQAFPQAVFISTIKLTPLFIIYAVNDMNEMEPIYLNTEIPRTLELLREAPYREDSPLTLLRYKIDNPPGVAYANLNLVNKTTISWLRNFNYPVGEHSIIKQTVVNRVVLMVPAGNQSMKITLNLADPRVLREIGLITKETDMNGKHATIELEDSFGFPIILKFDYTNPSVVQRLKALDNV